MAASIRITEDYRHRHRLSEKVKWLVDRVPSKEFRIEWEHEENDDYIETVSAVVTIWADNAEKLITEYWWNVG